METTGAVTARTPHARSAARRRRVCLAFAAAAFSTLVALAMHVAAGGAMPELQGILVPLGIATVLATWLSPIRASWLRLGGSVAVSQLGFHSLFTLGAPEGGFASGHGHHATTAEMASAIAAHSSHAGVDHSAHLGIHDPGMLAAHGLAAVATTLVLHFGEAILRRLAFVRDLIAEFFAFDFVFVVTTLAPRAPRSAALPRLPWVPHLSIRAAAAALRRGPPAARAFPTAAVN
jgi:hypothetical protein